ncbi:MAG: DUF4926 domain-containing protein [Cyanobacteria bacterium P01_A01_bin.105]
MTIHEYDIVALIEEVSATHPETQEPVQLRRGQVGTVLMGFDNEAALVDFATHDGQTYAMETIPLQKLMPLFYEPAMAAA